MQIKIIEGARPGTNKLLDRAFRLRHKVFVDEKKWEALRKADGREIDEFDGPQCTYVVAVDAGMVVGQMRMTPTTQPHLLSDVHFHLCARAEPRGPEIWEWTRFCARPGARGRTPWGTVAAHVQLAGMEWLYIHGIRDIVVEYHPKFIERHLELGFEVNPLGLPVEMDGEPVVAVHMRFDFNALHRTRVTFGVADSILMAGPQADAG